MRILFAAVLLLISVHTQAQSLKKPFKALNEGQFDEAASGFDEYKLKDSLDPQLWFGYARLFVEPAFKNADLFLSWQYILKSRSLYESLDEKGLKKLGEDLTSDSLNAWQKLIDDRLFERVQFDNSVIQYEKHLNLCPLSKHRNEVVVLRNAKAFSDTKALNTVSAYNTFMATYPDATEVKEALTLRNAAAFADATLTNTVESYQAFLDSFPQAADFLKAFGVRNELMLQEAIAAQNADSIAYFLQVMAMGDTPEHPVDKSLYQRAFDAQRSLEAKFHWVYYISAGNIYRMNEANMKAELYISDGAINSFCVSDGGVVVFSKPNKKTIEFFMKSGSNAPSKICDLEIAGNFSDGDLLPGEFYISNDLSLIFVESGISLYVGATKFNLWESDSKKWTSYEAFDQESDISKYISRLKEYVKKYPERACPDSEGKFFTKQKDGVFELYQHQTQGGDLMISDTKNFASRTSWGGNEQDPCISYSENITKVIFFFTEYCTDNAGCFDHYFVVNNNGTNQVYIEGRMSLFWGVYPLWLYSSGDLLWIDESSNLIRFTGKEQTRELLAPQVTMVKTVHIPAQ